MNGKGETIAIRRFEPDLVGQILPSEKMKDRVLLVSTSSVTRPTKDATDIAGWNSSDPFPLEVCALTTVGLRYAVVDKSFSKDDKKGNGWSFLATRSVIRFVTAGCRT